MIKTMSLSKFNKISIGRNSYAFLITRWDSVNSDKVQHLPALSPSSNLLSWFKTSEKTDENWSNFENLFVSEMSSPTAKASLRFIETLHHSNKDVYLICYCEDPKRCHRSIIAELLNVRGLNVVEE